MTNIALVVLDTVRHDSFYRAFDWLEGAHFTRAYSTAHWTVPAHASLFTGEYASNVGVYGTSPTLDCARETLAERLQEDSYYTRAWSANAQLNQYDGWDRGFDEFVRNANLGRTDDRIFDWEQHIETTEPGLSRNLSGVARCFSPSVDTVRSLRYGYELHQTERYDGGAKSILKRVRNTEFGDDEFLFCNIMDAHTPYRPPPGESEPVTVVVADALADSIDDPERLRAAYEGSVTYLSEVYREIHEELLDSFDYVITLSDHGELLGEHGLWNHSISLHPELIHVPLVISGPDIEDRDVHDVVSLLDVHRTIAELCGVEIDSRGRNLFEPLEDREFLFESHGLLPFHREQLERKNVSKAAFNRWQTNLHGFVNSEGAYCYESKPGEFRCLGGDSPTDPQQHLADLVDENIDKQEPTGGQPEVSAEVKDRLKDLGYA